MERFHTPATFFQEKIMYPSLELTIYCVVLSLFILLTYRATKAFHLNPVRAAQ
jgi:hypothetical protein